MALFQNIFSNLQLAVQSLSVTSDFPCVVLGVPISKLKSLAWGVFTEDCLPKKIMESLLAPLILWSPECASSYLEKLKLHWFCRKSLSTHQSTSAWVGWQNSPERDLAMNIKPQWINKEVVKSKHTRQVINTIVAPHRVKDTETLKVDEEVLERIARSDPTTIPAPLLLVCASLAILE